MYRVATLLVGIIVAVASVTTAAADVAPPAAAPSDTITISFPDGRRVVRPAPDLMRMYRGNQSNAIAGATSTGPADNRIVIPRQVRDILGGGVARRPTQSQRPSEAGRPAPDGNTRRTLLLSDGPGQGDEGDRDTQIGDAWHPGDESDGEGGGGEDGGTDEQPVEAPPEPPTLISGEAFEGTTSPEPGVSIQFEGIDGFDAKAIARWNVVPYQDVTETFDIGIVAFHMNGIKRVDFILEGGEPVSVPTMSYNQRSNTWEYVARLDPQVPGMRHGFVELRAVIYPVVGVPRVLQGPISKGITNGEYSLFLTVDHDGDLPQAVVWVDPAEGDDENPGTEDEPVRSTVRGAYRAWELGGSTIDGAGGATVYLQPGRYTWGPAIGFQGTTTFQRWLTLTAAPGVDRADVIIDNRETHIGFKTDMVRIRNVTVDVSGTSIPTPLTTSGAWDPTTPAPRLLWVDSCTLIGPGMHLGSPSSGFDYVWSTDSEAREWFRGFVYNEIARNCTSVNIGEQAFSGCRMAINCSVDHIRFGTPGAHPDVWFPGDFTTDNVILYGVEARDVHAQGLAVNGRTGGGVSTVRNVAFVNVMIEAADETSANSQWEDCRVDHVLMWHLSLPNCAWLWRYTDNSGIQMNMRNLSIRNSVFYHMQSQDFELEEAWFDNNHFINSGVSNASLVVGSSATQGDPGLLSGSHVPAPGSVLRNRVGYHIVPVDLRNSQLGGAGAIGAIQPE